MFSKWFRRKPLLSTAVLRGRSLQREGVEKHRAPPRDWPRYDPTVSGPIRFRVRPGYHSDNLLLEVLDDHRKDGFPQIASILSDALHSEKRPHPTGMDRTEIGLASDQYVSYWSYPDGDYEIDDDIWGGLFIHADQNNRVVMCDVERALLATGQFAKVEVDFEQFR